MGCRRTCPAQAGTYAQSRRNLTPPRIKPRSRFRCCPCAWTTVESAQSTAPLLQPEMILAREQVRMRALVAMPAVEIGSFARMLAVHRVPRLRVDHEADKRKIVLVDERLDLRNGQAMLLHVEAKVAAAAHVVEVGRLPEPADVREVAVEEILPEPADVVGGAGIAALFDQLAHCDDVRPAERAVEPKIHEAARAPQREEPAPARERIVQVVQHAAGLDHVEGARERAEPGDVGLGVVDRCNPELLRLALRIGKARKAQVDGEHARAAITLRRLDRAMSGAAAGDQHVATLAWCGGGGGPR